MLLKEISLSKYIVPCKDIFSCIVMHLLLYFIVIILLIYFIFCPIPLFFLPYTKITMAQYIFFYFTSFLAFCLRMLVAALDHNLHSFRTQATTKTGQPI